MTLPFASPPKQELPQVLKTQMDPYIEYFEAKYKEARVHTQLPFDLDEKGDLHFEAHEDNFNVLPGEYLTAILKNHKRVVMLGTYLGTLAMYEVDYEVKVPKDISETGLLVVTNYKLHAAPVFWDAGLLKLTMYGKVDISTYIDAFGYPQRNGRDDHNKHSLCVSPSTNHAADCLSPGSRVLRQV
jgi:hypothetical protein